MMLPAALPRAVLWEMKAGSRKVGLGSIGRR